MFGGYLCQVFISLQSFDDHNHKHADQDIDVFHDVPHDKSNSGL